MPRDDSVKKVLVIGSGPIMIGQAAEFDYSGSQALRSLREENVKVVIVNSNPATIQTDVDMADAVYIEPLTPEFLAEIIWKERPDALLPSMGGQTGLNLAVQLEEMGVLEEAGVRVIGTPVESIRAAEDRKLFFELMKKIGEPFPKSIEVHSVGEAVAACREFGYPVISRSSYCLGGAGSGIAYSEDELEKIVKLGLDLSQNRTVTLDECVVGWKEIEYEVMRDSRDNCITICNMENMDPMGIHTGESIVVAPAQTLSNHEHQTLRSVALKVIRALKLCGGCNIQFAVNPEKFEYLVIEVNPRVSRSSALASKATGYPIARVAAKLALGMSLYEIRNAVTHETPAVFEPALDYVVVKIPRWPFDKFPEADSTIGTQMKSTGEAMGIGRTFEEALQKAVRSLDIHRHGLSTLGKGEPITDVERLKRLIANPTDRRLFYIRDSLILGLSVEEISRISKIDSWFISKIKNIVDMEKKIKEMSSDIRSQNFSEILDEAKRMGFSDRDIASLTKTDEKYIRKRRHRSGIVAAFKMVDTCAAEFEAKTPYFYSSYGEANESHASSRKKVIVVGGGPIRIGQGIEFDYCCVHAVLALREEDIEAIVINNNPETVSTDFDTGDKLYFEPLTFEDVLNIVELENPYGIILQFGGQTPLNFAIPLRNAGVNILGTPAENIDIAEDRERFNRLLKKLRIPQPEGAAGFSIEEAKEVARKIGYPVLIRPSYVLGGRAMNVVYDECMLEHYIEEAMEVSEEHPILIDKFLTNAVEVDVDAVSDSKAVFIGGILEHIEQAGTHSGDATMVMPPQTLNPAMVRTIREYTRRLAEELKTVGLINVQYVVKNGEVYVLEVNPRASRTVPFVSKGIGIPLVKIATKVMLGYTLQDLGIPSEIKLPYICVKESTFPFMKLPGVDPILGPEMKSTGEVMGIDYDFGRAYFKSQIAAGNDLPIKGAVFLSIRKEDQLKIIPVTKKFKELGFNLYATDGTADRLLESGIKVRKVLKVSQGSPNILDFIRNGSINLVINTPTVGRDSARDGYQIRRAAVDFKIPYLTTLASAQAAAQAIETSLKLSSIINSLNEYHQQARRAACIVGTLESMIMPCTGDEGCLRQRIL